MVEIPHFQAKRKFVMPVNAGIQVTDNVRHTVGKRYPGYGNGDGPRVGSGFRRNDGIKVNC
jgi:hypothetical protein